MNKLVEYDFRAAYNKIDPKTIGMLRLVDVDVLIAIAKLYLVEHPVEMRFFFEALRSAMEKLGVISGKTDIDFFGKFDYVIHATSMRLGGKRYDFKISFEFHSIIGYHISVWVYFDWYGNFFVAGRNVETEWTNL